MSESSSVYVLFGNLTEEVIGKMTRWAVDRKMNNPNQTSTLLINSGGGGTCAAFAAIDLLISLGNVNTVALGQASSMAFPLFLCGKRRFVGAHTKFLLHELRRGFDNDDYLKPSQLDNAHIEVGTTQARYCEFVEKVTEFPKEGLLDLMKNERVIYAETAVKWGFAHEILTPENSIF